MNSSFDPSDKIILALDGMNKTESFELIEKLPKLRWVKVGLELFVSEGPDIIFDLKKQGKKIFLDLKFHDIPRTMARACWNASKTGAELISVHACAGLEALLDAKKASIKGAEEADLPPPTLLAVTVLTGWDSIRFKEQLAIDHSIENRVMKMAELALKADLGGCVCSPLEVRELCRISPDKFELVTPGIRTPGSEVDDQARVMSPLEAVHAGATKLVIGRSITRAGDPLKAFEEFWAELSDS